MNEAVLNGDENFTYIPEKNLDQVNDARAEINRDGFEKSVKNIAAIIESPGETLSARNYAKAVLL